jgi:hypothetical protein
MERYLETREKGNTLGSNTHVTALSFLCLVLQSAREKVDYISALLDSVRSKNSLDATTELSDRRDASGGKNESKKAIALSDDDPIMSLSITAFLFSL